MKLIIASNNKGKIREYKDIIEPFGFLVTSQGEENINLEVEETGTTFEQNEGEETAQVHLFLPLGHHENHLRTGGEPGLYSARYKGLETEHERRIAVLKGLEGKENRNARFVTCICFIDESGMPHLFTGIWNGVIAEKEEGTNGFGYDPIFISEDGNGKTTASMPLSFKETYSHRAKGVRKLIDYLQSR